MYCVDTNIFLDWWERRYPSDLFPNYQTRVESMIRSGKWIAPERVFDEIQHNGSAGLKTWALANRAQFQPHSPRLVAEADAVLRVCPGLLDPLARHDEADRYLIALAKITTGAVVVTHETPRSRKRRATREFIPDACALVGVQCIELLDLMRNERWSFT